MSLNKLLYLILFFLIKYNSIITGDRGPSNDTQLWYQTGLYRSIISGECLQGPVKIIQGARVAPYVLGDSGFPLRSYMMIPYDLSKVNEK